MAKARRCSKRPKEGFAGPGGHSENLEAWKSLCLGSWRLCTPYLLTVAQPDLAA